jgi:predicted metal-dependent hydrolase
VAKNVIGNKGRKCLGKSMLVSAKRRVKGHWTAVKTIPAIILKQALYNFDGRLCKLVFIHELIHLDLYVRGHANANHGPMFDKEWRRLLKYKEIRDLL